MLDVHPPHHAVHAWRDFVIHIATIVVGLLIAVGLEQTVEAIHRHHEREQLIENMRSEAERNRPVLLSDIARAKAARAWAVKTIAVLQMARSVHGAITIELPEGTVEIEGDEPSRAVWDIAKANGKAALVPDSLAEGYDRQTWEANGQASAVSDIFRGMKNFKKLQARLPTPVAPGATLHLSSTQADLLLDLLADNIATADIVNVWLAGWLGAADAIAAGADSRTEIEFAMTRRRAELKQ